MRNDMLNIERRVQRYWYTDGIAELAGGGMFLLIGLFFVGQAWLPEGSLGKVLFESSLTIVLFGGAFVTRWLVNVWKTRLTYPRTGYIEYRADQKKAGRHRLWTAIVVAVIAIALVVANQPLSPLNWLPALNGLLIGLILIYARAKISRLTRFYILAAFSFLLGLALSFGILPIGYRLAWFNGLIGLAFLISGGITLRRYLIENPLPAKA